VGGCSAIGSCHVATLFTTFARIGAGVTFACVGAWVHARITHVARVGAGVCTRIVAHAWIFILGLSCADAGK
jgi:hypothetical protein